MLALFSCADENIGSSIADTKSAIIMDSSFTMTGHSVANPRLQSRTSSKLVGRIKADGYGTLQSQVVTQFMPALRIDTVDTGLDMIDSCRLKLRVPVAGGFTGDSLAPMRLNVYRLSKPLPSPIYSDFDPTTYYDPANLLGSAPYSLSASTRIYDSATQTYYREVTVPMPTSLAQGIYTTYKTSPEVFNTPSAFAQYFPGVFITNSYGSGRVMNFTVAELTTYYRKHSKTTAGNDTIINAEQTYLGATPEVISNNILSLEIDETVKQRVADGEAIVMAPAGYELEVHFPIQDIINNFLDDTNDGIAVINGLEMVLPVETVITDYPDITPPKHLLMVKTHMKDKFIAGDSLTNNKDSFYAVYDALNKQYRFEDMRDYISDILFEKGGVATPQDMAFTITPVDVTTYTQQQSSVYYSTSSTTTVTKIAPAVSKPMIAKILLKKAKIKITYSQLSLF